MSSSVTAREDRADFGGDRRRGVSPSARKAALFLHAMPERDRAWLLSQLTPAERALLEPLLAEVRELGIPVERDLLDDALGREPVPPVAENAAVSRPDLANVAVLREAHPARLAAILQDEPPRLISRLLRIEDWPWRRSLLGALRPSVRRQVSCALSEPATRSDLMDIHLLAAVARRLAADPSQPRRGLRGWLERRGWAR